MTGSSGGGSGPAVSGRPFPAPGEPGSERLALTPRILLLDVDGTLAPIAETPEAAAVPPETLALLDAMASRPDTHLALVSGRSAADARRMVPKPKLWVIGNHGAELMHPDFNLEVDPEVAKFGSFIDDAATWIAPELAAHKGIRVEHKTWTLSVHYRLADPAVVPEVRRTVDAAANQLGLTVSEGKMVFEVRPPIQVHKGTAVMALVRRLSEHAGGRAALPLVLYAGDDRTDEDAFRALRSDCPGAITIRVAFDEKIPTAAEFRVRDPEEMRSVLARLAAAPVSASSSRRA